MTDRSPVRDDLATAEWSLWTTTARLMVADPLALTEARALVESVLAGIDAAASRFRSDSEVRRLTESGGGLPVEVSPVLADLVGVALAAAQMTDGDVDPTLGADLVDLGYDRDLDDARARMNHSSTITAHRQATWRDVTLVGTMLSVPAGVLLDLGATAKARAADLCATAVAERFDCGVLVSLGGDLRVAGPKPDGGWRILVRDGPEEPASQVTLCGAQALATSSTLHRVWRSGGDPMHHILDPILRRPAEPIWRTATVAATTCVAANTLTTAAMVRGRGGVALIESAGVAARLVAGDGVVVRIGGWPR